MVLTRNLQLEVRGKGCLSTCSGPQSVLRVDCQVLPSIIAMGKSIITTKKIDFKVKQGFLVQIYISLPQLACCCCLHHISLRCSISMHDIIQTEKCLACIP
jgi:hypothetical protein